MLEELETRNRLGRSGEYHESVEAAKRRNANQWLLFCRGDVDKADGELFAFNCPEPYPSV